MYQNNRQGTALTHNKEKESNILTNGLYRQRLIDVKIPDRKDRRSRSPDYDPINYKALLNDSKFEKKSVTTYAIPDLEILLFVLFLILL